MTGFEHDDKESDLNSEGQEFLKNSNELKSKINTLFPKDSYEETSQNSELTIAVLTSDSHQQSRFQSVLKKIDTKALYVSSLKDFYELIKLESIDLAIVDVRHMSEEDVVLQNHPQVKNNDIRLCFFYNSKTQPLLFSAFEVKNYGLINTTGSLAGQLKLVLERIEGEDHLVEAKDQSINELQKTKQSYKKIIEESESLKREKFYRELLVQTTEHLSPLWEDVDFFKGLSTRMDELAFTKRFGIYLLGPNNNRLISPRYSEEKFEKLPPLWLGEANQDGVGIVGQNQAMQVVLDLWGGCFQVLYLYDSRKQPQALIFIEADEDCDRGFKWQELEQNLNNVYSRNLLRRAANGLQVTSEMNSFDFYELIDNQSRSLEGRNSILKTIEFRTLFQTIANKPNLEFQFSAFMREFFKPLISKLNVSFRYSTLSGYKVAFLISETDSDEFDSVVKNYAKQFPFWRFFDSASELVISDLKPTVRSRPLSLSSLIGIKSQRPEFKPNTIRETLNSAPSKKLPRSAVRPRRTSIVN
ncbi:MAG: hypothetical protein ACPGJV_05570 [Bacteriovoracaceae bacterium]